MDYSSNPLQPIPAPDFQIQQLITQLKQTLDHPWQISEMAAIVGMERRQFERHFRAVTQHSPWAYLCLLRMQTAAERLHKTEDAIGEIARQVGYADVRYFRHSFKAWWGKSPSKYREQHAEAQASSARCTSKMSQISSLSESDQSLR